MSQPCMCKTSAGKIWYVSSKGTSWSKPVLTVSCKWLKWKKKEQEQESKTGTTDPGRAELSRTQIGLNGKDRQKKWKESQLI